ncbi:MAG: L-histidine N(alpha)-methyltransferase, partial [Flavobacteriales bacterium]
FLLSKEKATYHIKEIEKSFEFEAWEPIYIERSLKYSTHKIEKLATKSGFEVMEHLYDSKQYFVDSVWQVIEGDK